MEIEEKKQKSILGVENPMQMISCWIPKEWNKKRKLAFMSWQAVIKKGLESNNNDMAIALMKSQIEQLQQDYELLDADYRIRGQKLQKYVAKYGSDVIQ